MKAINEEKSNEIVAAKWLAKWHEKLIQWRYQRNSGVMAVISVMVAK